MDQDAIHRVIERIPYPTIVHAAASVPKQDGEYGNEKAASESVSMIQNLLSIKLERLLLVSSMTVYGTKATGAVKESSPLYPDSAYAMGKKDAENMAIDAGVSGYAIRIPGLFGEERRGGLVRNVINAVDNPTSLRLPDSPVCWSAMHVLDAAGIIADLVDRESDGFFPINVGYSGVVSVNRFVRFVERSFGIELSYDVEHPDFEFDFSFYENLLGSQPIDFYKVITEFCNNEKNSF